MFRWVSEKRGGGGGWEVRGREEGGKQMESG